MGYPRIKPDEAAKLAFTDASKNLADLKSRQWQATNFSVVALIAVATFSNGHDSGNWPRNLTVSAALILASYSAVMLKCHLNLREFRKRLRDVVDDWITAEAVELFYRGIYLTPPGTTGCGLIKAANGTGPTCKAC